MDHASAIDAWLHHALARRYRPVLREELPAELLAIIGEASCTSEQALDSAIGAETDRVGGGRAG